MQGPIKDSVETASSDIKELFAKIEFDQVIKFLIAFAIGFLVSKLVSIILGRTLRSSFEVGKVTLIQRLGFYAMLFLALVMSLEIANYGMATLLGAAGILSVALGFASQTSASNFISGLFLMGERAFQEGDTIQIENTLGNVVSIDLLSVKLQTFDNLFVRIPNESLIKMITINLTKYPLRRLDLPLRVSFDADLDHVEAVLRDIATKHPHCLTEPEPLFRVQRFGPEGPVLDFMVWTDKDRIYELRTDMNYAILKRFREEEIDIPVPQQRLIMDPRESTPFAPPPPKTYRDES